MRQLSRLYLIKEISISFHELFQRLTSLLCYVEAKLTNSRINRFLVQICYNFLVYSVINPRNFERKNVVTIENEENTYLITKPK